MTLGGRYRLEAVVGSGATGRVWRAHDELLDREVAVKELTGSPGMSVAQRRAAKLRAEQEARAAARLDDPGMVRVFDVVRTTGRSWIIMEYIRSRSLHDRVTEDGPLTHREAAAVGLGMIRALRTAHAAGIVHRAVKPQNVLLADDGRVVLINAGLAPSGTGPPVGGADRTQPLLDAAHYVAPERLRRGAVTEAADLWSLGATLYTAVEGRPPFCRLSVAQSLTAALTDAVDQPEFPGPLHPIIADLMATEPADRATTAETEAALTLLSRRAVGVSTVPVRRPPPDDGHFRSAAVAVKAPRRVAEVSASEHATRSPGRRGRRVALAVAAATAVLTAGAATASVWVTAGNAVPVPAPAAGTAVLAGPCQGSTAQPLTDVTAAPVPSPAGWSWHVDPAGFALQVPQGWTRAAIAATVCFSDPGGADVFAVGYALLADDGPLLHWQTAEISDLAAGTLPGYQRVGMTAGGGGADWEYTWQPPAGPRLHTRRLLTAVDASSYDELSWTTSDQKWPSSADTQNTFTAGFRTVPTTSS